MRINARKDQSNEINTALNKPRGFRMKQNSLGKHNLISFILIFLLSSPTIVSQPLPSMDDIMHSGNYYWGTSDHETDKMARDKARENMIEQIAVTIQTNVEHIIEEKDGRVSEQFRSITKTYTEAFNISKFEYRTREREDGVREYICYIEKSKVDEAFQDRAKHIREFIKQGLSSERDNNIGYALNHFYWAFLLLRTHPDYETLSYNFEDNQQSIISVMLPQKIRGILNQITIRDSSTYDAYRNSYMVTLTLTYKGIPVQFLDFIYKYENEDTETPTNAKEGKGIVQIIDTAHFGKKFLTIKIDYVSYQALQSHSNVKIAYHNIDKFIETFPEAERKITPRKPKPKGHETTSKLMGEVSINTKDHNIVKESGLKSTGAESRSMEILNMVLESIQKQSYTNVKKHFTEEGLDVFEKMIASGKVTIIDKDHVPSIYKTDDQIVIRSIRMEFLYASNNRRFVENVCFYFNKDEKIEHIAFTISDRAIHDIMSKKNWDDRAKEKLIQFMEDYKTAYCLKRETFIENLFADHALIYVGHMVSKDPSIERGSNYKMVNQEKWYAVKLSKEQYMQRLRSVFRSSEYINLRFEDNVFKKRNDNSQVYGIQINQYYYSSSYNDQGYLFLLIDFSDTLEHPVIYVRTWQPERNEDGSIFGIEDFVLN